MNDNIHDQIATLKDIDERLETLEEDYTADLKEVLKLADEIRNFDLIVMD